MPQRPPAIGEDVTALMGSAGNIDLTKQPKVKNPDGTISTVDSRSFNFDGQEVLLPSVTPDGRHLRTDAEIIAEYKKTGRHLGKFPDVASANAAAQQLHQNYAAGKYDAPAIGADVTALMSTQPSAPLGAHPEAKISAGRHSEYFSGLPPSPDLEQRKDANMFEVGGVGVPPEAALMGVQAGRAVLRSGLSMVGRAGTLATQATPLMKYYAAKHALKAIGIPDDVAELAAVGVSSYKRGGGAKPTAAAEPVAEPIATSRAEPVATPSATLPTATPAPFNPTRAMQTVRETFATLGEKPLPAEVSNASALIQRGKTPEDAVRIVLANRPKVTAPVDPAAAFNARFGTLTDEEARAALDLRNAQGKIKSPSAQTARERRGY